MDVNTKNKIIFLTDTLAYGGSERTVHILANSFERELTIITIADVVKYKIDNKNKIIPIIKKNYPGYIKVLIFPFILYKLCKIIMHVSPDIVVSFHFFSNILNVLCSKKIGYKSFVSERQYSEKYFGKKNIILKWLIPLIYNNSNGIICNDKDIKKSLQTFYKVKSPILVLNNLFVPFGNNSNRPPINDNTFRFLTVGRLSKEKNTKDIIKAFSMINNKKKLELIIVGDGYLRKELLALTRELQVENNVKFIGYTSEVSKYYELCDVFVFSSLNEGFPNVILEAMSFGMPIISYKFKAGIETIIEKNKYGILVDLHDVNGLKEKMELLINDKFLFNKFSKQSLMRVKDFSNKDLYISKFKKFIEDEK